MIPELNDDGYLPSGIHAATLAEIARRFGQESEIRRAEMESIRWLCVAAQRARVSRIVLNGSFVSDAFEPNDVDCVLLVDANYSNESDAAVEIAEGFPFLQISLVEQPDFDFFVGSLYAEDRAGVPKGMVEVVS